MPEMSSSSVVAEEPAERVNVMSGQECNTEMAVVVVEVERLADHRHLERVVDKCLADASIEEWRLVARVCAHLHIVTGGPDVQVKHEPE